MSAVDNFLEIIEGNRGGRGTGIYSICSAQETVLKAAMLQAISDDSILLVESTSNQVDQFGGYTGMTPADFVTYIEGIAGEAGFAMERLLLGGDHLGPNAWQDENAAPAMQKAIDLVCAYVKAGFQKIHLDASMFLADDEGDRSAPLDNAIVAERAAALCSAAEKTHAEFRAGSARPVYIIGTEVPIPGGATEKEEGLKPTTAEDSERTLHVHHEAFAKHGLDEAWERVCGLVVQPGVEFGDDQIFDYLPEKAEELSRNILKFDGMVYEAHSTDYQSESGLSNLVRDHFCILKVGPWVTFAYREALFALADIEKELVGSKASSNIKGTIEQVMLDQPGYWEKYYSGSESEQAFKRKYSFSDRSRYYWPDKKIKSSIDKLYANLSANDIPLSLLSQYLPNQYNAVREGRIKNHAQDLIINRIRDVIGIYARACKMRTR